MFWKICFILTLLLLMFFAYLLWIWAWTPKWEYEDEINRLKGMVAKPITACPVCQKCPTITEEIITQPCEDNYYPLWLDLKKQYDQEQADFDLFVKTDYQQAKDLLQNCKKDLNGCRNEVKNLTDFINASK